MIEQTKFEKQFIKQVIDYCVKFGSTPHLICKSFGYNNSVKINDFINGNGSISSRTMGKMIEHMDNNKRKTKKPLNQNNMKTIYFQPPDITPKYCEAGMISESDPEYIWYFNEPCKVLISEVKIIESKNVIYNKKSNLFEVIK